MSAKFGSLFQNLLGHLKPNSLKMLLEPEKFTSESNKKSIEDFFK
jgi:hypothetical protein